LAIADRIADAPQSAAELARATGAHAPSLERLLKALVTLDVCVAHDDGTFGLGAAGQPLRTRADWSLQAWATYVGQGSWRVWDRLYDCVMSGESARSLGGADGVGRVANTDYPGGDATFNRGMAELTRLDTHAIVEALALSTRRRVVDVGAGTGELLIAMLAAYPHLRGVLFERPAAIDDARRAIAASPVADRCELAAGDFFEAVPPGADVYVVKSVVHNWSDDLARRILGVCAAALRPGAALCLVERMIPARLDRSPRHQAIARADLNMLVSRGGVERTEAQLRALVESAGLEVASIRAAGATFSVLEAVLRR
jgi:orsellinic acid C2-O-methyltransferase